MTVVLIIAGVLLGAILDEFAGAIFGGLIAWLAARQMKLQATLRTLQGLVERGTAPASGLDRKTSSPPQAETLERPPPADQATEPVQSEAHHFTETASSDLDAPEPADDEPMINWQVPSKPEQHSTSSEPGAIDRVMGLIRRYFTEGNLAVRVGVVILFFGVAFLFKHAADNNLVPIQLRLAGVIAGGLAMLVVGWRLRHRKASYALVLQGGGVGVLYVTLFAAYRLYALISGPTSFALLLLMSAIAMALAVIQNARALAVTAVVGGFLAPVLASTGSGNHVALFSYYAILNLAILGVAWFKSWRELNLIGFGFTFIIGTAWGIQAYQPHNFDSTEPFLILFFALYSSISVLFAMKQPPKLRGLVDGTLVFGTPIICFTLQAALVEHMDNAMAWSAVAVAIWYGIFSVLLWRRPGGLRTLAEAFAALAIIFGSMAIPLALDGRWTAAAWAIEGAGMLWIGLRQNQLFPKVMGILLQVGGGFFYLFDYNPPADPYIFLNSDFLGIALLAVAGYLSAMWLDRSETKGFWKKLGAPAFLVWGLLWWYLGGLVEAESHFKDQPLVHTLLAYVTLSGLAHLLAMHKLAWPRLRHLLWLWAVFPLWLALVLIDLGDRPLLGYGWLLWPAVILAGYVSLYFSRQPAYRAPAEPLVHLAILFTATLVVTVDSSWWLLGTTLTNTSWQAALTATVLGGILAGCLFHRRWPVSEFPATYQQWAALGLIVVLAFWYLVHYVFTAVDPSPWAFLPLLNPMDLSVAASLTIVVLGWRRCHDSILTPTSTLLWMLGVVLFVWINTIALQSLHHWTGVAYRLDALADSQRVQTTLTILWTLIGLGVMVTATRQASRLLWFCGAGLMGVVVLKLFTVDLSSHGTIERVISFIGVGVLLLIVGYFSPMPPSAPEQNDP
ncbi:MAG: membrane protein [Lysobacteraceae bacterium]|nr:MAG: membrane protein [Xanthomonadaceae bacterium]